jgi:hypothetical protein
MSDPVIQIVPIKQKIRANIIFPKDFAEWICERRFDGVNFHCGKRNTAEIRCFDGKIEGFFFDPSKNHSIGEENEIFEFVPSVLPQLKQVLKTALVEFNKEHKPTPKEPFDTSLIVITP